MGSMESAVVSLLEQASLLQVGTFWVSMGFFAWGLVALLVSRQRKGAK